MITAVLTDVGRAALAASLAAQSLHYAWGEGDAAWDADPDANTLYLRVTFDFEDAPRNTIREVGVFVGTVVKAGVPPGKKYVTPSELEDGFCRSRLY